MTFVLFSFLLSFICLYTQDAEWEQIVLYSWDNEIFYKATSENESPEPDPFNPGPFSAVRMFDGDRNTCWAEGVPGKGIGEAFLFSVPEKTRTLNIINGFADSEELFFSHNRVKKMRVSLYLGVSPEAHVSEIAVQYYAVKHDKEFIIELQDTQDEQVLYFPFSWTELKDFRKMIVGIYKNEKSLELGSPADVVHYILRLEIQEVYKGSETDVTCISEISIEKDFDSVNAVYLSEDERALLMDTNRELGVEIDRDNKSVFQIIDFTEDNQWLVCMKKSAENREQVETEYNLYNTFIPQKIDKSVLGEDVIEMYGFIKKSGKLFLEYFNSNTSQIEYLDLEKIKLR